MILRAFYTIYPGSPKDHVLPCTGRAHNRDANTDTVNPRHTSAPQRHLVLPQGHTPFLRLASPLAPGSQNLFFICIIVISKCCINGLSTAYNLWRLTLYSLSVTPLRLLQAVVFTDTQSASWPSVLCRVDAPRRSPWLSR